MMFLPRKPKEQCPQPAIGADEVALHDGHLIIGCAIARQVFGNTFTALLTYYPQRHTLLLACVSDEAFKTIHKAQQGLLKVRNKRGDMALSIQAILVDHQIDDSNRTLPYELREGSGILIVTL